MGFNVFGDEAKSLVPFEETAPEDRGPNLRLLDHVGKAGIFTVAGVKEVQTQRYGMKPAIEVPEAVILDSDGSSEVFTDQLVFGTAPVDQMKGRAGQTFVAIIGSYESKSGTVAPRLEAPTQAAVKAAEAYVAGKGA